VSLDGFFFSKNTSKLRRAFIGIGPTAYIFLIFIPVTRRVKGYTRLVAKYVTDRPKKTIILIMKVCNRHKEVRM